MGLSQAVKMYFCFEFWFSPYKEGKIKREFGVIPKLFPQL